MTDPVKIFPLNSITIDRLEILEPGKRERLILHDGGYILLTVGEIIISELSQDGEGETILVGIRVGRPILDQCSEEDAEKNNAKSDPGDRVNPITGDSL